MNTTKYLETTNNYYRHCNIIIFQWDIKNATHIGSHLYLEGQAHTLIYELFN